MHTSLPNLLVQKQCLTLLSLYAREDASSSMAKLWGERVGKGMEGGRCRAHRLIKYQHRRRLSCFLATQKHSYRVTQTSFFKHQQSNPNKPF